MILEGRVAIVTGAGSGIGRAGALAMAREGAVIVAADRNAESGEATSSRWAVSPPVDEIAESILFLASDRPSFMTGHAFVVDGGECIA